METSPSRLLYAHISEQLLPLWAIILIILITLPLMALLGFRAGRSEYIRRGYATKPPSSLPGDTSLGAMLALLGLLLAFTYGSAMSWMNDRQTALVNEVSMIGTAFLHADLLADPGRTDLKTALLDYGRTRLPADHALRTREQLDAYLARTLAVQAKLWPLVLEATGGDTPAPIRSLIATDITSVLDAHTDRVAASSKSIADIVKLMILLTASVSIFLVGNRSALHGRKLTWRTFSFAGTLCLVMIVVTDLDRPVEGLLQVRHGTMLAVVADMEQAMAR